MTRRVTSTALVGNIVLEHQHILSTPITVLCCLVESSLTVKPKKKHTSRLSLVLLFRTHVI